MAPNDDFLHQVRQGMALRSSPGHREGKPRRLLDNGELNLGHSVDVPPAAPFNPAALLPTIGTQQRILDLRSDSNLAQFSTVTFSPLPRFVDIPQGSNLDSAPFNPGPLIGIVEFGNGSAFSRVEVDIPVGSFTGNSRVNPNWFLGDVVPLGGTSVSVPGSSVRAFARNDGNYVPGASPAANSQAAVGQDELVKIQAHIAYGIRPIATRNTRTYWLAKKDTLAGLNQNPIFFGIPPFARSFRINRTFFTLAAMPAISITIYQQGGLAADAMNGPLAFAAGVDCPEISLPDCAHSIELDVTTGGVAVNVAAVFEIGL